MLLILINSAQGTFRSPGAVGIEELITNLVLWFKVIIELLGALLIAIGVFIGTVRAIKVIRHPQLLGYNKARLICLASRRSAWNFNLPQTSLLRQWRRTLSYPVNKHRVACALRSSLIAVAMVMLSPALMAQQPEPQKNAEEAERPLELFGGYSYLRDEGHNLNGWTGTLIANVNSWFGLAADFDGHYGSHREGLDEVRQHEYGFTFGPHFAFKNRSRVTPFAFTLLGGAHENVKTNGVTETATSFAANFGGGLDARVNERWSVRLIQVDASYTRFNGEGKTSPRVSAGLVFHFGKPR
jgi:hypothetical protein